jgi:hypothetical protein
MLNPAASQRPATVVTCCPYVGGILFRCSVGGIWSVSPDSPNTVAWPSNIVNDTERFILCTTDCPLPPVPPALASRCGIVGILDFLLLCGAKDTTHARTSSKTSKDAAVRALARNSALIQRYQNAGPYENILIAPIPHDLCPQIDAEVAARMAGYIPSSDVDLLKERLRCMPNHVIDLRGYKSYSWKRAV